MYVNQEAFLCVFRPITLVVAKCWDPNPRGYFAVPQKEPVRPIDPSAWVAHTGAMQQIYGSGRPDMMQHDLSCVHSVTSSSLNSSVPPSEREYFICYMCACILFSYEILGVLLGGMYSVLLGDV